MSARSGALILLTTGLVAACGSAASSSPHGPGASSASATGSATPDLGSPLVAVLTDSAVAPSPGAPTSTAPVSSGSMLSAELLSTGGSVTATTPLPSAPVPNSQATGPDGVYFVGDHGIERLNRSGTVTTLAALSVAQQVNFGGMVVSPGGGSVIYAINTTNPNATVTTELYSEKGTAAASLIASLTRLNVIGSVAAGGYLPLRWDADGLLLGTDPYGIGGNGAFPLSQVADAIVVRYNLTTKALSAPLAPDGCEYGDVSDLGTVACILGQSGANQTIELIHKNGSTVQINPGSNVGVGDLHFQAGTDNLAFDTASASAQTAYVLKPGSTVPAMLANGVDVVGWSSPTSVLCATEATSSDPVIGVAELVDSSSGKVSPLAAAVTVIGIVN